MSITLETDLSMAGEKTMRAIAVTAYGGPEVLQLTEVPEPQPGPGQVVIRVAYAGVNFAEIMGRVATPTMWPPPPC